MKKYLNSPEQLLIALKLGKVVYKEGRHLNYKMVEGIICSFEEETKECVLINAQVFWLENHFYIIEK